MLKELRALDAKLRAKYSADELDAIGKSGNALKNESGDWSYPINDHEDFVKAKKAVGRGGSDHDKIRAHVIKVAKKKGWSDEIPDNWNGDGSLKGAASTEDRDSSWPNCQNCNSGKMPEIDDTGAVCPDCNASRDADGSTNGDDAGIMSDSYIDGSSSQGNQAPQGLVDGTGSVSSRKPREKRAPEIKDGDGCGCCPNCQAGAPPKSDDDSTQYSDDEARSAGCGCGGDAGATCGCGGEEVRVDSKIPRRSERRRLKPRHSSIPAPNEFRVAVGSLDVEASGHDIDLVGEPIMYNRSYSVHDMFGEFKETMAQTVCDRVLARGGLDCRFLVNHDGIALGRTIPGTLELLNESRSLRCIVHLDDRQSIAYDLAIAIERGDMSQMSCGFVVELDEWNEDYTDRVIRSFGDLLDVSAVTYPASPTTSIQIAQRALFGLSREARSAVQRSYAMSCDITPGARLGTDCIDYVARALEQLYMINDPQIPTIRVRQAMRVVRDVRAGKVLSASNAGFITSALMALHRADDVDIPGIVSSLQRVDDSIDAAHQALANIDGVTDPDADDDQGSVDQPLLGVRDDEEAEREIRDREDAERREQERKDAAERRRKHELARLEIAKRRGK